MLAGYACGPEEKGELQHCNIAKKKGMTRVGQNHIYTVYIRYFWLGNHQIYGVYIRIYTVLANPRYDACACGSYRLLSVQEQQKS